MLDKEYVNTPVKMPQSPVFSGPLSTQLLENVLPCERKSQLWEAARQHRSLAKLK